MEQFVLRGSGADGCSGAYPAVVMWNAAQSGDGFLPGVPAVPRYLLYHKMNGLMAAPPAPNGTAGRPAQSDDWHEDAGVSRKRRCSEADDERLRRLWHSNHSLEEIAEAMGRTTPSLYSRARALGMSKRSPATGERAGAGPATNGAQGGDAAAPKAAPASGEALPAGSKRQREPASAIPRTETGHDH